MNKRLRNFLLTFMGVVVTVAGLIYIGIQYNKLLSALLTSKEESSENGGVERKCKDRFRQIEDEEGVAPEILDEDDLSADL